MDFLNDFSVLILDESVTRQELFSKWISSVTTQTISSPSEIQERFDSTVAVACLSQSALGDDVEAVKKYILTRNPCCQIVGVLPRSSFVSPFDGKFDAVLQRPVFEDEFQEIIEYRFIAGIYSQLLSEFYDVNSTLVAIERAGDEEIADREVPIERARNRCNELKSRLDSLQDGLSPDTIMDILQTVQQHKKFLKTPDQDVAEGKETKFRPRRCPSCHLPWGVHHRNELGSGYKKLGANVYQCARCEEIVHGLAGEHQVV